MAPQGTPLPVRRKAMSTVNRLESSGSQPQARKSPLPFLPKDEKLPSHMDTVDRRYDDENEENIDPLAFDKTREVPHREVVATSSSHSSSPDFPSSDRSRESAPSIRLTNVRTSPNDRRSFGKKRSSLTSLDRPSSENSVGIPQLEVSAKCDGLMTDEEGTQEDFVKIVGDRLRNTYKEIKREAIDEKKMMGYEAEEDDGHGEDISLRGRKRRSSVLSARSATKRPKMLVVSSSEDREEEKNDNGIQSVVSSGLRQGGMGRGRPRRASNVGIKEEDDPALPAQADEKDTREVENVTLEEKKADEVDKENVAVEEKKKVWGCLDDKFFFPHPKAADLGDSGTPRKVSHFADGDVSDEEVEGEKALVKQRHHVYEVESVAEMEKVVVDEGMYWILSKWSGFRYLSWCMTLGCDGVASEAYRTRCKLLYLVEKKLSESLGSNYQFRKTYPQQKILRITDDSGLYLKQPGMVYVAGLMTLQRQLAALSEARGDATLYVVDWTSWRHSTIPDYIPITNNLHSAAARELLNKAESVGSGGCDCKSCCISSRSDGCCAQGSAGYSYSSRRVVYTNRTLTGKAIKVDYDNVKVELVECGVLCKCAKTCSNRRVQAGRKVVIVIFMDDSKGWTIRTLVDLQAGDFVCEYVGEVLSEKEATDRGDAMYQMNVDLKMREDGRKETIIIDASKKGNEARFISHSCEPNLFPFRIEMQGAEGMERRVGMFAKECIPAGSELTFDYFDGGDQAVSFECKCGSENCRFNEDGTLKELNEDDTIKKEPDQENKDTNRKSTGGAPKSGQKNKGTPRKSAGGASTSGLKDKGTARKSGVGAPKSAKKAAPSDKRRKN